jgi:hypothetical protein
MSKNIGLTEVVVDPEEVLLDVAVPGHGEALVTEETAEDLLTYCHRRVLRIASHIGRLVGR